MGGGGEVELFKGLFGRNKDEVWQQLCREIGADFIDGGIWKGDKVQAHVKGWTITLDSNTETAGRGGSGVGYTRMRAPYLNRDGFRFKIYREGLLSGVAKKFGMQDVEVGVPEFDDEFIIQANDEDKIRKLCANSTIRKLIQDQPSIHLEVKDDEGWAGGATFPQGVDELSFEVPGIITDLERLKSLYELFVECLNQLCQIGSAEDADPGLSLQ